ncbi:hypothetical protein SAMN05216226_104245 [Halovenus aranensis]|uniref:Uncharacterized protein n=1 Tax=Halovenus aranensis TaxID=890420 RepID=A0A1G8UGB2_9EURY|nr:hypothetical protein [Halovenus aranensis]SDJ52802.1 hypothetical protein SAMN05216226_104245 [Halovenus aranensis]
MASTEEHSIVDEHTTQPVRTLIELRQRDDGTWVASQMDVDVEGTGETGALAAMDYCRWMAAGEYFDE